MPGWDSTPVRFLFTIHYSPFTVFSAYWKQHCPARCRTGPRCSLSPDAQCRGPETRAATRLFRRPARFGSTPVAGQVLRMDAIGRLTAPPRIEVVTATVSDCGSTSRGILPSVFLPNSETRGFLLDTFSGPSHPSFRIQGTERGARTRGFAPQTPPPVSAPCIVLSALPVAA